jgi:anti-sigma factor ChrR (cupin superfamily)
VWIDHERSQEAKDEHAVLTARIAPSRSAQAERQSLGIWPWSASGVEDSAIRLPTEDGRNC